MSPPLAVFWDLTIARPEGYDLPEEVEARCRGFAEAAGSAFAVTSDREAALDGAKVVYAKSWGAMSEYGAAPHRDHLRDWTGETGVTAKTRATRRYATGWTATAHSTG